jgi:hypothetical protein
MKGTPEEVLKAIPDFDQFMKLSEEISALMYRKLYLDAQIKEGESNVFKTANTAEKYFQGGKPPSATFVDNTYKFTGLEHELIPIRTEQAMVISELEGKKQQMDIYKTMIEVWRTLCSNQRTAGM